DPVPGAITIMTVHASKGLEFDAVAVPFMHEEGLPSRRTPQDAWLSQGGLPYALRGDRSGLPSFDLRTMDLHGPQDLTARLSPGGPLATQLDDHHRAAERRLAYVALTRARAHLFVSASRFTVTRKRPVAAWPFLAEAAPELAVEQTQLPEAEELGVDRGERAAWPTRDPDAVVERRAALLRSVGPPRPSALRSPMSRRPLATPSCARSRDGRPSCCAMRRAATRSGSCPRGCPRPRWWGSVRTRRSGGRACAARCRSLPARAPTWVRPSTRGSSSTTGRPHCSRSNPNRPRSARSQR